MIKTPKLPPVAAFRLLGDLTEFLTVSPEVRKAAYADYMAATEQRQVMLDALEADKILAAGDRAAAGIELDYAKLESSERMAASHAQAKGVVSTAKTEAKSMSDTAVATAAAAREEAETWSTRLKARERDITAREAACIKREDDAFEDREDAVTKREVRVNEGETNVKRMEAAASAVKAKYEALMQDIAEIRRRAG